MNSLKMGYINSMVSYFAVEKRTKGDESEKARAEAQRAARAPVVERRMFSPLVSYLKRVS